MDYQENYRTPGQLLQSLLDERGWTQRIFSIVMGLDKGIVNKIVADKRPIDAETALLLAEIFGERPERFLDLQKSYDLAQAKITARPDPGRATRAKLFGDLPITDMIKRGWLQGVGEVGEIKKVEAALVRFFHVQHLDEIEILPHAARKTDTSTDATPAQLVWLYRVKQIASEMLVGRYSHNAVHASLSHLNRLLSAPEEARKVPRILAECGIRYVIVESIASAKIDGVCLWLDDKSPVIGMSLRHDRIDNFWFVLRHEIEHVLQLHGKVSAMMDIELEGERAGTGADVREEERIANEAASEFCVSRHTMDSFVARKAPFFAERDILGLARTLQIHPGLVAGQLQHRTGRFDRFRQHLVKIRSAVAPGAMVDGWGDIAPVDM